MVKISNQSIINKVKNDYNMMADHFDKTRFVKRALKSNNWIITYLNQKDIKMLDIGCGNARMIDFFKTNNFNIIDYLGVDISSSLLQIAKEKYPEFRFINKDISKKNLKLKMKNEKFGICLSLSVMHHLPDKQLQLNSLKNINKLLKKNGLLFLKVWNLWQKRFWLHHLTQILTKIKQHNLKYLYIPYKISDGHTIINQVNRFFYAFTVNEIIKLLEEAGFKIIDCFTGDDLCFIAQKC